MKRAIIFDFDGTVADTFAISVEIFHHVTGRADEVDPGEVSRLREMSLPQVARALGVPWWKLPYLVWRGKRLFADKLDQAHAVPGMYEELKHLSKSYDLYIVSSNSPANVQAFLVMHGIDRFFTQVFGNARLGGKARIIRRVVRRGNYNPNLTCYVGDETRDIEAAKHAGVRSIAVAWGYNNIRALNKHHPDKIVFDPIEIRRYVAHLGKRRR